MSISREIFSSLSLSNTLGKIISLSWEISILRVDKAENYSSLSGCISSAAFVIVPEKRICACRLCHSCFRLFSVYLSKKGLSRIMALRALFELEIYQFYRFYSNCSRCFVKFVWDFYPELISLLCLKKVADLIYVWSNYSD